MGEGKTAGAYDAMGSHEERLVAAFISEELNLNWTAHQPVLVSSGRSLNLVEIDIFIPSFGIFVEVCRDPQDEDEYLAKEKVLRDNGISALLVKIYEMGWKAAFLEELVAVHAIRGEIPAKLEAKFPEEFARIRKKIAVDLHEFLEGSEEIG
ncbi:TPA: hypothetical protein HA225_02525 [Candidatus Micrarchaeota archaeon]|nr:hypothetical protein [Candidatus Micrarchaeota archaeon]HIH30512.1 hypothetical protein [Candidatus Micrarchaeota archaeon]